VASGTEDERAPESATVGWGLGDAGIGFALAWLLTIVCSPLV
jgi:hypothetical protein